jgi:hypothetical protein
MSGFADARLLFCAMRATDPEMGALLLLETNPSGSALAIEGAGDRVDTLISR